MKQIFPIALFMVLSHLQIFAQDNMDSSGVEPKNNFEVLVNGKKYIVPEGEQLKLEGTISNPTISIKESDRKKFESAGIAFEYPKHLSFEFEKSEGYKNWTLTGNDFVVMLFEIDGKTALASIVEEMVKKF